MIRRITAPATIPSLQRQLVPAWRYAIMVVAIAFATLIAYLYVVPNSEISASIVRIGELKGQVNALERENADLLQETAVHSDLKTLELRAAALGMGPARGAVYLRLPAASTAEPEAAALTLEPPAADETPLSPADLVREVDVSALLEQVRSGLVGAVDGLMQRFNGQ